MKMYMQQLEKAKKTFPCKTCIVLARCKARYYSAERIIFNCPICSDWFHTYRSHRFREIWYNDILEIVRKIFLSKKRLNE